MMVAAGLVSTRSVRGRAIYIRQFAVTVVDGPDRGKRVVSQGAELSIGTSTGNDLQLTDGSVSRHHCVLQATDHGLELRDLGSTNGTLVGEVEIRHGFVGSETRLRLGTSLVAIALLDDEIEEPLATDSRFGELHGASPEMRRLYPILERCAQSMATVLIEGETGTGKELVAEAIHHTGPRRRAPFVIVDCGALPRTMIESELFGHVRGAYTGAEVDRVGAFESAQGGTVLLDEIGELPLALQPVLLRALENRTIRRLGTNESRPIDVRILAATNRDLRVEVNHKRFRADLFYRLNVLRVVVPPLRKRPGDVALLVEHFWRALRPSEPPPAELVADFVAQDWPGNVRELRNAVERAVWLGARETRPAPERDPERSSYGRAKDQAVLDWERGWVEQLMAAHRGNLSRAARAAKMGRSHLRDLVRKHLQVDAAPNDDDDDE
jgi:two-component system response regulator GlrR